jgi:hypothetical protein
MLPCIAKGADTPVAEEIDQAGDGRQRCRY